MNYLDDYAKIINLIMSFRREFFTLTPNLPKELITRGLGIDSALDDFIEYIKGISDEKK